MFDKLLLKVLFSKTIFTKISINPYILYNILKFSVLQLYETNHGQPLIVYN